MPAFSGESSSDFEQRLTSQTDIAGNTGTDFGPYLKQIPKNPYNDKNTVRIDGADAGANTDGWRFDTISGFFQPDDSDESLVY